jgi:hypothetical protein
MSKYIEQLKQWRGALSRIAAVIIVAMMIYWGGQNYSLILQVFASLGIVTFVFALLWLALAFFFSLLAFVWLVRSLGYSYSLADGYRALNLAQVAAMVPGSVWGWVGLAGLLWSQGISKRDSALIIFLNAAFGLAAGALFGAIAFIATFGWQYTLLGVVPMIGWMIARNTLEYLRQRFFAGSSSIPSAMTGLQILAINVLAWSIESACFAWFILNTLGDWATSPLFIASAYAAGYFVGYITIIAPSGLGVREATIVAILGGSVGIAQVFAIALSFRIIQTLMQWLNIALTLLFQVEWRNR